VEEEEEEVLAMGALLFVVVLAGVLLADGGAKPLTVPRQKAVLRATGNFMVQGTCSSHTLHEGQMVLWERKSKDAGKSRRWQMTCSTFQKETLSVPLMGNIFRVFLSSPARQKELDLASNRDSAIAEILKFSEAREF
jgi:hypothetical protein